MDSSTLLNALFQQSKELEHWESADVTWLHCWTTAVVLGVALELALIFWEYCEDLRDFKRGTIRSPECPSVKKLMFEVFACALVVGGVAGELVVARSVSEIETRLRIISNQRVGIAGKDAADARERTATVEASNKKVAVDLEREKQKTAKSETALAEAQTKAVAEQKEFVKFTIGRVLVREIRGNLVGDLKKLPPANAEVWYRDQTEEPWYFAVRIRASLIDAGWHVPKPVIPMSPAMFGHSLPIAGVTVYTAPQSGSEPRATSAPVPTSFRGIEFPDHILSGAVALSIGRGVAEPSETDVKLAILGSALGVSTNGYDPALPLNSFIIVVADRSSVLP